MICPQSPTKNLVESTTYKIVNMISSLVGSVAKTTCGKQVAQQATSHTARLPNLAENRKGAGTGGPTPWEPLAGEVRGKDKQAAVRKTRNQPIGCRGAKKNPPF